MLKGIIGKGFEHVRLILIAHILIARYCMQTAVLITFAECLDDKDVKIATVIYNGDDNSGAYLQS